MKLLLGIRDGISHKKSDTLSETSTHQQSGYKKRKVSSVRSLLVDVINIPETNYPVPVANKDRRRR